MAERRKWPWMIAGGGVLMAICAGSCLGVPCLTTGVRYGIWADQCPVGDLRLQGTISSNDLLRGNTSTVYVRPEARFLQGSKRWWWVHEASMYRGTSADLVLLDAEKQPVEGMEIVEERRSGSAHRFEVRLDPELADGDYTLRSTIEAPFETVVIEAPLALYVPALVHVATDRPLYKPGQEVLMRSAVLRRDDLAPLDGRPGEWSIMDPSGAEMHKERSRGGPWGISALSFALDEYATEGTWTVRYTSGADQWSRTFDVRPFQLPRVSVSTETSQAFFGIGDTIEVSGSATYASGAPVADGLVSVRLRKSEGRWAPPVAWEEPLETTTDASGRFTVKVGKVPADLVERATVSASVRVSDATGETASGAASIVLSKDPLRVEAVTELGGGLVEGLNNRAYLRVMTPDGAPLRGADVTITNAWAPGEEPRVSTADADGVVAVNIDPGAPVTIVGEASPSRYRPLVPPEPSVVSTRELVSGRSLSLAERRRLDGLLEDLVRCQELTRSTVRTTVALRTASDGRVREALAGDRPVDRCVLGVLDDLRFDPATPTTWALQVSVPDGRRPALNVDVEAAFGLQESIEAALQLAALESRHCLPLETGRSGARLFTAHYSVREDAKTLDIDPLEVGSGHGLSPAQVSCVAASLKNVRLPDGADSDGMGVATFDLDVPRGVSFGGSAAPTSTGFELGIQASVDGESKGQTRLVLPEGQVPRLRLRAEPTLITQGGTVSVQLLRGPSFRGSIPKKLLVMQGQRKLGEAEVDPKTKTTSFTVPDDVVGFVTLTGGGERAVVFVERAERFDVALSSDKSAYGPGETAKIDVVTTLGGKPISGGVTLAGVDQQLGELAPLAGPDDFGDVTVRAKASDPAFGTFDPRALVLGQIRGENAAQAAVLRISDLPVETHGDLSVGIYEAVPSDDDEVLVASFYRALAETQNRVRRWEREAPKGEQMTPKRMAGLWTEALDALAKTDSPAVDAYGRTLTLDLLSEELLEQVDPHSVVADSTRLPEDVEPWVPWVGREVNR